MLEIRAQSGLNCFGYKNSTRWKFGWSCSAGAVISDSITRQPAKEKTSNFIPAEGADEEIILHIFRWSFMKK